MNIHFDTNRHHHAFRLFDRVAIGGQARPPVSGNEVGYVMMTSASL